MPNDYVTKSYFDEHIEKMDKKLDKMSEQLDWLIGNIKGMKKNIHY